MFGRLVLGCWLSVLAGCQPPGLGDGGIQVRPGGFLLSVANGSPGSQIVLEGYTAHVFADLNPRSQRVAFWRGDTRYLSDGGEWHRTLLMPGRPVSVEAVVETRAETFADIDGGRRVVRPAQPVGLLVLVTPADSGSVLDSPEGRALAWEGVARGLAVSSATQNDLPLQLTHLREHLSLPVSAPLFLIALGDAADSAVGHLVSRGHRLLLLQPVDGHRRPAGDSGRFSRRRDLGPASAKHD